MEDNVQSRTDQMQEAIVNLVKVLSGVRSYVVIAIEDDGGIDNCEIGERLTLEAIDHVLRKGRKFC